MMIAVLWDTHPLDMLLKRYGHFMDQTRREAILKFDLGCRNGTQAQSEIL